MLENVNDLIVTDAELISLIRSELDLLKGFCEDEKPSNIPPILKIWDSTKKLQIFPLSLDREFNRSSGRRQILINLGAEFYRHWGQEVFPAAVMLLSEAWVKAFSRAEVSSVNRAPSDYPDAIECVVVQALTLTKSSTIEKEANPRTGLAALEIKRREPYLQVWDWVAPTIMPTGRETTDLLNHFYMGWAQEDMREGS